MNHDQPSSFSRRRFCALLASLPVAGLSAGDADAQAASEPPVVAPPPPAAPPPAAAEDYPFPPPKSTFEQLFPKPTGENGYEDVIRATDLVRGLPDISGRDATLAQKRALLATPQAQKTLATLRAGLNRQVIQTPFTSYDPATLFPHFAPIRAIARLLSVEQYVLLADGKTPQAVDNFFDGLRMANVVKGEVLIGGLVAVAVDAIVANQLARRLDMLSARDCDRLTAGVRQYLTQPDAAIGAFETEHKSFAVGIMVKMVRDPATYVQDLTPKEKEDGDDPEEGDDPADPQQGAMMAEMLRLGRDKTARDAFADAVERHFETASVQAIASVRDPSLPPPKPPTGAERASLAYRYAQGMMPGYPRAASKFQIARVQVRLLGVHGAVRRFRWEHNRLPETLAELPRIGDLLRDPFTGEPLLYKRTGETTFDLSSAGPFLLDHDGYYLATSKRTPVTVPTPPRPAAVTPPTS